MLLVSCGESNHPNKNKPVQEIEGNLTSDNTWFGVATKCLKSSSVLEERISYEIICSEMISGKDEESVRAKLNSWKEQNCSWSIEIMNSEQSKHYQNCSIKALSPQSIVFNNRLQIAAVMTNAKNCQAQSATMYGSVSCN